MKPTTRKPKKQDNPEFQNFGAFVKYHFGTKSEGSCHTLTNKSTKV